MGYKYNGSPLSLDVAWRDTAGTQYPSNWLRNSTAAQRAAVPSGGVTWENDPPGYDQEFYTSFDKPKDIKTYNKLLDISYAILDKQMPFIDLTDGALFYHADYVKPSWARTKHRTTEIGDHIFYTWD